jgi:single-strand DNA-binding protein
MNNCSFVGRLTASPELKQTANGTSVCNFSLAVERRFSGSDGEKAVDYIDFVAWKHNADFLCKWFDKGVRVAVTGELQTRMYEDKDGKKIKVSEIIANTIEFADGKRDANATPTAQNTNQKPSEDIFDNPIFANEGFMPIAGDDELPFK